MESLSTKYITKIKESLLEYGVTLEDFVNNFKYCGGDDGSHLNYYKLNYPGTKIPNHTDKCICGHHIQKNCYIQYNRLILVLGNCCIKRFVKNSNRTCERCNEPHRNRIVNRCNDCRKGVCDGCGKRCKPQYPTCWNCKKK